MPGPQRDEKYSSFTAVIFLFNLIIGTGALTLPGALQKAGWLLGVVLLIVLAAFSFITVTFVVESLAVANALSRQCHGDSFTEDSEIEETPLVPRLCSQDTNVFEITEKYEIGRMGVLLSPKWCQILIYFCLCLYLYGDLAIYEVVLGKTFSEVVCNSRLTNGTIDISDKVDCYPDSGLSTLAVYRISIVIFTLVMGPFVFFNLQKTKVLQFFTTFLRWLAFFIMVVWNIQKLITRGKQGSPSVATFDALPALFGSLVYSFMCQHSIPGLLQPIKNKDQIKNIIMVDFTLATVFYIALAMTAIFTFHTVLDLFTLNFWQEYSGLDAPLFPRMLAYYLVFFPVFAVSTNFPIIAITLRNNLRYLIVRDAPFAWYYDKLLFPLLTILPPTCLALTVSDVFLLVGIIGSYAGTCVQYLIPCLLVYFARCHAQEFNSVNSHASLFKGTSWIWAVGIWMLLSLVLITINMTTKP